MLPERFKHDIVKFKISDTEYISLPQVFTRNLRIGLNVSDRLIKILEKKYLDREKAIDHLNDRHDTDYHKLFNNNFYNDNLLRFDCHTFFLASLGFKINVKKLKKMSANYQFSVFSKENYVKCENLDFLIETLLDKFSKLKTNILAAQIANNNWELTHSLFFVKEGKDIYVAEKDGWKGMVFYMKLENSLGENYFKNPSLNHGHNFAFGDWYEIATNPKIHKQFEEEFIDK